MTYRTRRRLSVLVLVVVMPLWLAAALALMSWWDRTFGRMPVPLELLVYLVLGVVWILPFKRVFLGVGKADPDAPADPDAR
jgi:predicted membrane channel-forming protein YqfA (hemolysin III family)